MPTRRRVGERLAVDVEFDPAPRVVVPPPAFVRALEASPRAREAFGRLTPSRQKEIVRYLANLKTEEALTRNIVRVISGLADGGRVVGRDVG